MKKIVSLVMVLALTLAFVPLDEDVAKAASKPSVADKAEVSVGKIVKLKIKTNGFTIKSVDVTSDKSKVATASTTKKEISIKGKAAGKAKLTVRIKAKKGSKKKTFKQSVKVTVVEALNASNKGATEISKKKNAAWLDMLDFNDKSEEENAKKGLIGSLQAPVIKDDQGNIVWDVSAFDFIKQLNEKGEKNLPGTINPSLFRNTLYNSYAGLFEVCKGIYQVRGYDMANVTFIQTDHGWIVFDVLMCKQDMEAAKALMEEYAKNELKLDKLDIKAVLYSHSHVDHYGGIYGLIDQASASKQVTTRSQKWEDHKKEISAGKTAVIAPEGFLEHAVSENIYAGGAMSRRAQYQYGTLIETGEQGSLAMGIGLGQSVGNTGLLAPTYDVTEDQTINIDGLEVQFQLTPGTEAPAEMNAFFPKYNAMWLAENCTGTMHNLYTLRGAEVRDAADWAGYILEAKQKFGDKLDVVFQSHNWPHWGTENIKAYMENTAAVYQYIHDQTLHYANLGYTPNEISNMITFPDKLNKVWYTRQYYGTLRHNIKAVYQKYLGWYDANPVNLDPLPPSETAKKLVEYLGSTDEVLKKAKEDFKKGDYQWVAQVTKELVFANPDNKEARYLCADALEQLGYQSESGTWRNCYLTGARELRNGNLAVNAKKAGGGEDVRASMTAKMMLDFIGIATDVTEVKDDDLSFNLNLTDTKESFYIKRISGTLLVYAGENRPEATATITCEKKHLLAMMGGKGDLVRAALTVTGDTTVPERFYGHITTWTQDFNIIEP